MTVTKAELETINRRLQETIWLLQQQNAALCTENRHLQARLTRRSKQLVTLSRQYQTLSDYIRTLREWLNKNPNQRE